MRQLKILYLAPLLPAPSGSGGKRAIYNHLEDMLGDAAQIDAVFVDVEGDGGFDSAPFAKFRPQVFNRAVAKFGDGIKGKVSAIAMLMASSLPRSLVVIASKHSRLRIGKMIEESKYDAVIVDHLNAYGLIRGLNVMVPVVYVAHNVESEVLRHSLERMPGFSIRRLVARLDFTRMRRVERELLAAAARIVIIGAGDATHLELRKFTEKLALWPELPKLKVPLWTNPRTKSLLFVGSAKYFPNKDAIEWLVSSLMPALQKVDAEITLSIAGTKRDELGYSDDPAGVSFHGFVSDAKLDELHRQANLFICPVVLGAGIKIKMLEAASYGLPSAATRESLLGIDFLKNAALLVDRDAISETARNIATTLANQAALNDISDAVVSALKHTISDRVSLIDHVRAART